MEGREEIFEKHSKVFYDANDYGTRVLTRFTYDKAFQEYSDQQSKPLLEEIERLKGELKKEIIKSDIYEKRIEQLQSELKTAEWISVEDRLPKNNCDIALLLDNSVHCGFYLPLQNQFNIYMPLSNAKISYPTHWMPLPNKPKTN